MIGPTGGYLLGFLPAVLVAGGLIRLLGRRFWSMCLAMAAGMAVCYLFGTLWYLHIYMNGSGEMGFAAAIMQCVVPFLLPDGAKILLAAWMTKRLEKMVRTEK